MIENCILNFSLRTSFYFYKFVFKMMILRTFLPKYQTITFFHYLKLLVLLFVLLPFVTFAQNNDEKDYFQQAKHYLKNKQYDLYKKELRDLEDFFLNTKDSTHYFLTAIKYIELYRDHINNKDSLLNALNKVKKIAQHYDKPIYQTNYKYLYAAHLTDEGNYVEALSVFQQLETQLKGKNYKFIPIFYDNYARLLYLLKDYEQALEKLKISASIFQSRDMLVNSSASYNNLGILYKNLLQKDSSIYYHKKSLEISLKLNDSANISKSYNNISTTYKEFNDYTNTEINLKKAFEYAPKNLSEGLAINYADILILQSKYVQAEKLLLQVKSQTLNMDRKVNIFERLSITKKLQGDYKTALLYSDSIIDSSNKLLNETKIKEIEKLKTAYATKEKENEIKLLKQTAQLQTERNQSRFILTASIFGFILVVLGGLFFRIRYKQRNLEIEKLKLEQKVLRAQMNPHFIFNVLTSIQNSVMTNNPLNAALYISRFSKLIRQNFDFIQKEYVLLSEDIDALKNYLLTQQLRFQNKFDFNIIIDESLPIEKIKVPPMMLQPFAENAIEHGFKNIEYKGTIEVSIKKKNKHQLAIQILDNGKGYHPKLKTKKDHAIAVFKKRLFLNKESDAKTFSISNRKESGTQVSFLLTLDEL